MEQAQKLTNVNAERGLALIIVLWILSILSVVALELSYAARTELKIATNIKDETQNYYVARAGIERGIAQVLKQAKGQIDVDVERWDVSGEEKSLPFGHGIMRIRISDESGKINLNSTGDANLTAVLYQALTRMGVSPQIQEVVVDSILDWKDPDSLHRVNGAEDAYYSPLGYKAKNGPFDTLEELLMVRGVTPEIFYGGPPSEIAQSSTVRIGLRDIVTIYPRRGNRKPNVNAASVRVLLALGATEEEARSVAEFRWDNQIRGPNGLRGALGTGVLPSWSAYVSYGPTAGEQAFTIEATGSGDESRMKRTIRTVVLIRPDDPPSHRIVRWTDRVNNNAPVGFL